MQHRKFPPGPTDSESAFPQASQVLPSPIKVEEALPLCFCHSLRVWWAEDMSELVRVEARDRSCGVMGKLVGHLGTKDLGQLVLGIWGSIS